jgi:hypothetical protein
VSDLVLSRLRDLFLTPATADARPARQVAERTAPSTLGLLAAAEGGAAAGAALALAAAAAHRSPCALMCRWPGAGVPMAAAPAVPTARRLASRLDGRGLVATARGRLVTVSLPSDGAEARASTERALAAAGDVPLVLAVTGPRPEAFDPLLARLDRLVIAPAEGAPPGLEDLALDAAARLGRATGVLRLPPSSATAGRMTARWGLLLSPTLRAAASAALGGRVG